MIAAESLLRGRKPSLECRLFCQRMDLYRRLGAVHLRRSQNTRNKVCLSISGLVGAYVVEMVNSNRTVVGFS